MEKSQLLSFVSEAYHLWKNGLSLLEGQGVVVLAGLTVSHQVAGLFAQPEQRLCICPANRSVVPAKAQKKSIEWPTAQSYLT